MSPLSADNSKRIYGDLAVRQLFVIGFGFAVEQATVKPVDWEEELWVSVERRIQEKPFVSIGLAFLMGVLLIKLGNEIARRRHGGGPPYTPSSARTTRTCVESDRACEGRLHTPESRALDAKHPDPIRSPRSVSGLPGDIVQPEKQPPAE